MRSSTRHSFRAFLLALFVAPVISPVALAAEKPDVRARIIVPAGVAAGSKATLAVEMTLGPHWHVNSHTPSESFLIPTDLDLTASAGTLSPVRYPKHVERRFAFAEKPLRVYEGTVRFEADLELPAGAGEKVSITGKLTYQACNDKQCFPPATIPLEATLVATSAGAGR